MPPIQYIVEGGHRLAGTIEPSGNKNAALPIIAAALLTEHPVTLENVPRIRDTETLVELIRSVGASAEWTRRATRLRSTPRKSAPPISIPSSARGSAPRSCWPGRCSPAAARWRCRRPAATSSAGGVWTRIFWPSNNWARPSRATHRLEFRANKLKGADVFLDEPSVTATENALVAAVAADGTTYLRNAASEPHVQDLAHFLVALGAKIEGIGTNTIIVHGPATLGGTSYAIQPDHIEVGSLIGLAAVTRSPLRIARAGVEHLRSIRMGFERLGIVCGVEGDDLVVPSGQTMKIHDDFGGHVPKLEDQPWPAFPADLMSIAIVTATQCDGVILMFEKMFESRMFFVDKLIAMGAASCCATRIARSWRARAGCAARR